MHASEIRLIGICRESSAFYGKCCRHSGIFRLWSRDDTDCGFDSAGNCFPGEGRWGAVCGQSSADGEYAAFISALEAVGPLEKRGEPSGGRNGLG